MGKHYQGRGGGGRGRGGSKALANQSGSTGESASTANYRAPAVGYEDQVFSDGTTKTAATFTAVLTKLARMVSLQSWAGATIAGQAMEKLEEPKLIKPQATAMVYTKMEELSKTVKGKNDEPDTFVTRTRDLVVAKYASVIMREQSIWMIHYKKWILNTSAWDVNPAKIFALVLEHCPSDLEEVLKTLSAWDKVEEEQDAIKLLKLVRDVAMDKTETKQTGMSYVGSFFELFLYHQGKKDTLDYYIIMFKANVDSIKAHEGQPWHNPRGSAMSIGPS